MQGQKLPRKLIKPWNREEIIWAAGLFEGEGCLTIANQFSKGYKQVCLSLKMADLDVVEKFRDSLRFGKIQGPLKNGEHKPLWRFAMYHRQEIYAVVIAMYPWLGERRRAKIQEFVREFFHEKI